MDLAEQLTQFYGPEPALDVARRTLKKVDVHDVAARLKEQRAQRERGVSVAQVPAPPLHCVWAESGPQGSDPGCPGGCPRPPKAPCGAASRQVCLPFRARPRLF